VVELDLPPLKVSIPEYAIISKINKNDDLQLDIEFDKNPDDYFFAVVLLYNLEIVATKRQSYTSFAVKIWDLYNQFSRDQPDVLLRVTFYDPNYFTPSYSSQTITLNFEPIPGTISITPTSGNALSTIFNIELSDFVDEDLPL
jgi:hypothetical protein